MGVASSSGQGEAVPRPSPGNCLWPLMWSVTSVSMSTRGHSHLRGLVPQDGLFGGSGAGGSGIERGPYALRLLLGAAGELRLGLLTERSRVRSSRCRHRAGDHQRTKVCRGAAGGVTRFVLAQQGCAPGAWEGVTWSTRSAASMNDVDPDELREIVPPGEELVAGPRRAGGVRVRGGRRCP